MVLQLHDQQISQCLSLWCLCRCALIIIFAVSHPVCSTVLASKQNLIRGRCMHIQSFSYYIPNQTSIWYFFCLFACIVPYAVDSIYISPMSDCRFKCTHRANCTQSTHTHSTLCPLSVELETFTWIKCAHWRSTLGRRKQRTKKRETKASRTDCAVRSNPLPLHRPNRVVGRVELCSYDA